MSITAALTDSYVAGAIAGVGFLCLPISNLVRRRTRDLDRGYALENRIQVIGCCILISGILLSAQVISPSLMGLGLVFIGSAGLMNGLAAYRAVRETFVLPAHSIGVADRALTISAVSACALPFAALAVLMAA